MVRRCRNTVWLRALAAMVAVWLAAGLSTVALPTSAEAAAPVVPREKPVRGRPVPVRPVPKDPATAHAVRGTPAVHWPKPGTAEVTLATTSPSASPNPRAGASRGDGPRTATAKPVRAGTLPVWVGHAPAADSSKDSGGSLRTAAAPSGVRVEVLDRAATAKAGVTGLLLRVSPVDRRSGRVSLTVGYSGFRSAYGGDWASRLRLVTLPDCTAARCPQPTALATRNDAKTGRASALIPLASTATMVALDASPAGGTGDYKATSLSPSGSWQVSNQTGDFAWSYPLRIPPAPGGLSPALAMTYASGTTDGRTASTNNQPSWVGEGWDLWPGFVERSYKSCADDTAGGSPETGDECWGTENATLSFAGHSSELVLDTATSTWRPKNDDGSRVEHLFSTVNGDDNGEYWKVTTTDGVQYFFGRNRLPGWSSGKPETRSAWTVPVFGDDAGEPCHGATFDASSCPQAYRWNLDHVVDTHGNSVTYYYQPETNFYGRNLGAQAASYTRGGFLERAEYGTRAGEEFTGSAPARVVFETAERCAPGSDCAAHTTASYPDVPWDQECGGGSCPDKVSPTFWSTKRLSKITTQVWGGTSYRDVDSWTFDQIFPAPGDGTSAALWLRGITHTGLVGDNDVTLPEVTFEGTASPNRVNSAPDGLPPLDKYRMTAVNTESGGTIGINYAPVNCTAGALPVPESNTLRCFPQRWTPEGGQPFTDWFHKYVVEQVEQVDRVGGAPTQVTSYDYLDSAAWAFNDNPLIPAEHRTWSTWRGYEKVRVRHGDPGDTSAPQSATEFLYFRGMSGDHLPSGTRTATITDSQGTTLDDAEPLAGFLREQITYNGLGGPVVTGVINDPWQHGPTATQGSERAFIVKVGKTVTRTALSAGGFRTTEVGTSFDDLGITTQINNLGDTATAGDDQCTRNTYARNTGSWLLTLTSRVETVAVACSQTPTYPDDVILDSRTYYDGGALGAAPSAGDVTKTEELDSYTGGTPSYATVSQADYDEYGRVTQSFDELGGKTTTTYTPATGLPTGSTVTNPLGHTTTTTIDPAWGQPLSSVDANGRRTDLTYDALGRLTAAWLPGRSEAAGDGPTMRYAYGLRPDGPSWISTQTLKPNNNYITGIQLFDGFLRPRQTQDPAPGGGRILTDTIYDSRGLTAKTNGKYFANNAPSTNLLAVGDNQIPTQTLTTYDGAERPTTSTFRSLEIKQWESTTEYGGDHIDVTPPPGATPTSTYVDARGRTTELRQYHGAEPEGAFDVTRYTYTRAGKLASLTDPADNTWTYTYDLRGRKTRATDPDKGVTASTYDNAGQVLTTTDARDTTVAYVYDALGRKTEERKDSATGPVLARWTYDTLSKGALTASTRFVGTDAYTTAITGYDTAGRPTGSTTTIPAAQTGLAGNYQTTTTYRPDGSPATTTLPALGDLGQETLTYTYDTLGLPLTTTGFAPYISDTTYSALGELAQLQLGAAGSRVWQSFFYDPATRRLEHTQTRNDVTVDTNVVADVRYTYDPAGNITKITDDTAGSATDIQCFTYDNLRRLTHAWTPTGGCTGPSGSALGGPAPYWTTYTYDKVGNRLTQTQHGMAGAADTTSTYTYSDPGSPRPHAIQTVTTTGPSGQRLDTYGYDATGNTTTRNLAGSTQTLNWDTQGRLTTATDADNTTTYIYDADGNRLITRDPTGATLYLPSGELHANTSGQGTGTRYYSNVATRTAAGVTYLIPDNHGTNNLAINATTLQATTRRFDPFGNPRGTQPTTWPDNHGFIGGVHDTTTALTHLGARDYDPTTGHFISVDPLLDPGDPQQLNAYAYSNNNPTTFSDPTGMFYGFFHAIWSIVNLFKTYFSPAPTVTNHGDGIVTAHDMRNRKTFLNGIELGPNAPSLDKLIPAVKRAKKDDPNFANFYDAIGDNLSPEQISSAWDTFHLALLFKACQDTEGLCSEDYEWRLAGRRLDPGLPADASKGAALGVLARAGAEAELDHMGGGLTRAVRRALAARLSRQVAECLSNSFVTGSTVLMADGSSRPIEKIKLGNKVLTTDPETGKTQAKAVVATIIGDGQKDLVEVTIDTDGTRGDKTGVLIATDGHPFWAIDGIKRDWTDAGQLKPGMWLRTSAGTYVQIAAIKTWTVSQHVHNLTIADTHTYYVLAGNTPVLVHNSGGCFETSFEKAGGLAKKFKEGQSTRDPSSQWYHEYLSNEELLDAINKAPEGEGILVSRGGQILGGHHRWDELLARIADGRIDPNAQIRIDMLGGGQ